MRGCRDCTSIIDVNPDHNERASLPGLNAIAPVGGTASVALVLCWTNGIRYLSFAPHWLAAAGSRIPHGLMLQFSVKLGPDEYDRYREPQS